MPQPVFEVIAKHSAVFTVDLLARWRISSIFSPSLASGLAARVFCASTSCVSTRSFASICLYMVQDLSDLFSAFAASAADYLTHWP